MLFAGNNPEVAIRFWYFYQYLLGLGIVIYLANRA